MVVLFLTNVESIRLFYFLTQHFHSRQINPSFSIFDTQNKYSNQVYVIKPSDYQKTELYQGSADHCAGDRNYDLICLLQQSQAIHYCNQSVLSIVPDLNIFVFSIKIFDLIPRSALVQFILLRASYLYNLTGLRCYLFCLEPASRLCDCYHHRWVHYIDTTKITLLGFVWYHLFFIQYSYYPDFFCSWPESCINNWHYHVWVLFIYNTKIEVACM